MSGLRDKAHEIVDAISEKKMAEVVDFLEYLKIKEEFEATNEIISDKKLLAAFEKGVKQAKKKETIPLEDVIEDV